MNLGNVPKPPRNPSQIVTVNLPIWMLEVIHWFIKRQIFFTRSEMIRQMIILGVHEYLKEYQNWLLKSPLENVKFEETKEFLKTVREELPIRKSMIDAKYIQKNWADVWEKLEMWFK